MTLKCILLYVTFSQLISVSFCAKGIKSKSVTTLINAKWKTTPIALEVSEYLADENPEYFWQFLDSICDLTPPLSELSTCCCTINNDVTIIQALNNEFY